MCQLLSFKALVEVKMYKYFKMTEKKTKIKNKQNQKLWLVLCRSTSIMCIDMNIFAGEIRYAAVLHSMINMI